MLPLLGLSRGLVMESAAEPPGVVLGREDTEGDLGGAAGGLDLVRKRRACAASLFTSVSNSTACVHAMPASLLQVFNRSIGLQEESAYSQQALDSGHHYTSDIHSTPEVCSTALPWRCCGSIWHSLRG